MQLTKKQRNYVTIYQFIMFPNIYIYIYIYIYIPYSTSNC